VKRWGSAPDSKWELDKARQARRSLEKVRLKLLSPTIQAMDSGTKDLGVAVDCLRTLEAAFTSGQRLTPEWRRLLEVEMRGLRLELREVNALLEGAVKFYEGWARLVATGVDDAPAHYSVQGMPIPPAPLRSGKVVAIG
jgi:hypothetical protein